MSHLSRPTLGESLEAIRDVLRHRVLPHCEAVSAKYLFATLRALDQLIEFRQENRLAFLREETASIRRVLQEAGVAASLETPGLSDPISANTAARRELCSLIRSLSTAAVETSSDKAATRLAIRSHLATFLAREIALTKSDMKLPTFPEHDPAGIGRKRHAQ